MDLVERLRAALDEEERVARNAHQGAEWVALHFGPYNRESLVRACTADETWIIAEVTKVDQGEHIARQDPRRTLARVEALRKILKRHEGEHECSVYDHDTNCSWVTWVEDCATISALAEAYGIEP